MLWWAFSSIIRRGIVYPPDKAHTNKNGVRTVSTTLDVYLERRVRYIHQVVEADRFSANRRTVGLQVDLGLGRPDVRGNRPVDIIDCCDWGC